MNPEECKKCSPVQNYVCTYHEGWQDAEDLIADPLREELEQMSAKVKQLEETIKQLRRDLTQALGWDHP